MCLPLFYHLNVLLRGYSTLFAGNSTPSQRRRNSLCNGRGSARHWSGRQLTRPNCSCKPDRKDCPMRRRQFNNQVLNQD